MKKQVFTVSDILKINKMDLTRLSNGAHDLFGRNMLAEVGSNEVLQREMPALMAEYQRVVEDEARTLALYKGSPLTPKINEASAKMTAAWSHFKAGLRFYEGCDEEAKVAAAQAMLKFAKDYDVERNAVLQRVLGLILDYVQDCEGEWSAYITTLGMAKELGELKQWATETNRLLVERTKETADFETDRMKAARRATDEVWRLLVDAVNGWIIAKGAEGLDSLVAYVNRYILEQKRKLGIRSRSPEASPEDPNSGLPEEEWPDDTDENQPTTPPTTEPGENESTNPPTTEPSNPGTGGGTDLTTDDETNDELTAATGITVKWTYNRAAVPEGSLLAKEMIVAPGTTIPASEWPEAHPGYHWNSTPEELNLNVPYKRPGEWYYVREQPDEEPEMDL